MAMVAEKPQFTTQIFFKSFEVPVHNPNPPERLARDCYYKPTADNAIQANFHQTASGQECS